MTISEIFADLDDRIADANQEAAESHRDDANCYGAGYDAGYLAALLDVNRMFAEIREEFRDA